ncbi:MAG: B12-binding domain-containing radical SAM protein [Flavobacteriales bacterium]
MSTPVLLLTPPFTQLNTPYPATAYLKGFLATKNIQAEQADLGIDVTLALFSKSGLKDVFRIAESAKPDDENCKRILALKEEYLRTIDAVIRFLQDKDPTLAHAICSRNYLPEASRFLQTENLDWAFGEMGTCDRARHLATLYLEDLNDLIVSCIDPEFGFTRYAERLGRCANTFDALHEHLNAAPGFIDTITLKILDHYLKENNPALVAFTVPFPGNLYSAFRCAQHIRNHYPHMKVAMGGGFANTELRSVSDPHVFNYFHYITLDDGEAPLECLMELIHGKRKDNELKRTFLLRNHKVEYVNHTSIPDYKQTQTGTPDYSGLRLKEYLSVIEIANPMHRLWSDGRWNKLTLAHGCYWGKCTFCDVSLDYIKIYEFAAAKIIVDRMETLIAQTEESGFHFVDEAAPTALMRELALEILRRNLNVTWWTNIRFEKSFTKDLCRLLAASGCIAVSGGLEVASDRLLELIDKGVTVEQVTKVAAHFTECGIMVHAYLMYGYPTQTIQETVDSLEVVRQLFENGVLQSGFWHRFALTTHSPVGMHPEKFGIKITQQEKGTFANNDLEFVDPTGCDHDAFAEGLRISLYNYMLGAGYDLPLQKWFDKKIPKSGIARDYIRKVLEKEEFKEIPASAKLLWIGGKIQLDAVPEKGNKKGRTRISIHTRNQSHQIAMDVEDAKWLINEFTTPYSVKTFGTVRNEYEIRTGKNFLLFWHQSEMDLVREAGLIVV